FGEDDMLMQLLIACLPNYQIVRDFFFSSRRRHTSSTRDWSSDVCSSDLPPPSRLLLPRSHAASDALRVQIERFTDALEGEDPGPIAALDPLSRLALRPPSAPGACDLRHAIRQDRIIEDRGHEPVLAQLFAQARPGEEPHRTRRRSDGRHWHPHCIGRNAVGSPLRRGSAVEGGRNSVLDGDYIGTQDFVTFEDVEAIASNGLGLLCRVSGKEVWVPYANMARRERTVRRPGDRGRLIVPHWLAV